MYSRSFAGASSFKYAHTSFQSFSFSDSSPFHSVPSAHLRIWPSCATRLGGCRTKPQRQLLDGILAAKVLKLAVAMGVMRGYIEENSAMKVPTFLGRCPSRSNKREWDR